MLCEPFERTNRNVTFGNYFTSFELAQTLLSKGLTCVGTLRKNKRCIPANFLPHRVREVGSNVFGFRRNMTIVSYVPKKNRAVILLSTMHHSNAIDVQNKKKSEINLYYNRTKGGVDTLDQMCHAFTVRRKTRRWSQAQFYNIIDVCGIAAKVIWLNLYPNWNQAKLNSRRKLFLKELAKALVIPNIQRRSKLFLSKSNVAAIDEVLGNTSTNLAPTVSAVQSNKRRRCYCCCVCQKPVCNEHSQKTVVCLTCKNK